MKKICTAMVAIGAMFYSANAQLVLSTQFINPCGGDEHNEFIVAKTAGTAVSIADICFGSYNPSTNANGQGGTPVVDYNYWWHGSNIPASPYPIFSALTGESGGNGLNAYGFRYPSKSEDIDDINELIGQLNAAAGCSVFLPVPGNDIIPANSNVIIFLGAGYRSTSALCGFDDVNSNLNFGNHCSNGAASSTYYAVFGTGSSSGPACNNNSGGYFSNSSRRVSALHTFNGGNPANAADYTSSLQDYTPGTAVNTGNAGIITPAASGSGTTWINNQGCVPEPTTVLAIRLDYFTANLKDKKVLLQWKSAVEDDVKSFVLEKSLNGKDFFSLRTYAPQNTAGAVYNGIDDAMANGNNFYRLKITNVNGTIDHSPITKIIYTKGAASSWYIYPNPTPGNASLVYQSATAKSITVNLTDAAGKTVNTMIHKVAQGNNKINIPAESISSGMYIIKIITEGKAETAVFIKR